MEDIATLFTQTFVEAEPRSNLIEQETKYFGPVRAQIMHALPRKHAVPQFNQFPVGTLAKIFSYLDKDFFADLYRTSHFDQVAFIAATKEESKDEEEEE